MRQTVIEAWNKSTGKIEQTLKYTARRQHLKNIIRKMISAFSYMLQKSELN